ncbi:MAG TPA: CBS domain-containing protein [Anaerolineales bacterium]|nr:CBS domain-containing protein [Anaerolineales bacterium]
MAKLVKDIMTPRNQLIILNPHDTIEKARRIMHERSVNSILIPPPGSGRGGIWRIFTSTDLLVVLSQGIDLNSVSVEEFASFARYFAGPDWTYEKAIGEMARNGVQHMPVIDNGELVGIISSHDLFDHY